MKIWSLTKPELEESADVIKVAILNALVSGGLIEPGKAEKWTGTHTLIMRTKPFFRTLTDRWKKEPNNDDKDYWIVVGKAIKGNDAAKITLIRKH